jgi:lysophospholipase L1-like esterase
MSAAADSPQRPLPSRRSKLVPALISLTVALLLGEVVCRLVVEPGRSMRFQQDVDELQDLGLERLAGVIVDDPELFWRFAPEHSLERTPDPFFSIISNAQGLREDHVIPSGKLAGEKRVLFIGDSCTFGFGLDYAEGFVEKSEALLGAEFPNADVECINAGVPGYSLFQGWRFLETQGLGYDPDVVVLCFGWNDMSSWDSRSDFEHYRATQAALPPRFLRGSMLARKTWSLFAKAPSAAATAEKRPRLAPDEFRRVLDSVKSASDAQGVRLLVLVWGFLYQVVDTPDERTPWQRELYAFAERTGVALIDLVPEFQRLASQQGAPAVFFDYGHATAAANSEIARLVTSRLTRLLQDAD